MALPLENLSVIVEIGRHLALVLLVGLLIAHLLPAVNRRTPLTRSLLLGVLFAALALLSLLLSMRFDAGVYMDARTGIAAVAGAVGGWPPRPRSAPLSIIGAAATSNPCACANCCCWRRWSRPRKSPGRSPPCPSIPRP